jgi:hypothetical protein
MDMLFLDYMKRLGFLRDCSSAFNVVCQQMEYRMAYGQNEQVSVHNSSLYVFFSCILCIACNC